MADLLARQRTFINLLRQLSDQDRRELMARELRTGMQDNTPLTVEQRIPTELTRELDAQSQEPLDVVMARQRAQAARMRQQPL